MIRLLKPSDVTEFKKLRLETLQLDPGAWLSTWDSEKDVPDSVFENRLNYWSHYPGFGYYGYFNENDLIAYILISPNSWSNKKHMVMMSDFVVGSANRRQGVGKELVQSIVDLVKNMGSVEQVQLFVNSENFGAITFYEKFGFKKVATVPESVKNSDGSYQDECIFILKI